LRSLILFSLLLNISVFAQSDNKKPEKERCNGSTKIECGWHYGYIDPLGELETKQEKKEELPPIIIINAQKEKDDKEKCTDISNWEESCGFIDPGIDFDFQAKQRDIFLKNLLMKSHDPQSVENMQRYQKWLVTKAVEASKVWEFNMVQKPELSASTKNPISSFGLSMATRLREDTSEAVLREVKSEGGLFVWFTRSDCPFCHKQTILMDKLQRDYDLKIRNVSLDAECMPGYEDGCFTAPYSILPAKELGVNIVPSFYVYMPKDDTWIRVSNGLESTSTIISRIRNFFLAVKSAHINGINNGDGNSPSIDFKNSEKLTIQGTRQIRDNNEK